ncbi:MAG: SH3 domain-containing protein [Bacteroidales bacterium]|nr:SH3 domain-containing protein [Bacteroidales bacterium]
MKKLVTFIVLLLLCMAGYAAETYVVNSPNLNMRVAPKGSAEKMGELKKGDVIQVDTIINGWATCRNDAGETFYVASRYLEKAKSLTSGEVGGKPTADEKDPAVVVQKHFLNALSSIGIHIEQSKSTRYFEYMLFLPLIVLLVCWILSKIFGSFLLGKYIPLMGLAILGYYELKCMLCYSGSPGFFVHDELFSIVFWLVMLSILFFVQSIFFGLAGEDEARSAAKHIGTITVFGCGILYLLTFFFFSFLQPWIILLLFVGLALHLYAMFVDGDKGVMGIICFAIYAPLYVVSALATFLFLVMFIGHMIYLMGWIGSVIFILLLLAMLGGGGGPKIIGFIIKE